MEFEWCWLHVYGILTEIVTMWVAFVCNSDEFCTEEGCICMEFGRFGLHLYGILTEIVTNVGCIGMLFGKKRLHWHNIPTVSVAFGWNDDRMRDKCWFLLHQASSKLPRRPVLRF